MYGCNTSPFSLRGCNSRNRCLPVESCLSLGPTGGFCGEPAHTGLRVPTTSPSVLIGENAYQVSFDTLVRSTEVLTGGIVWGGVLDHAGDPVKEWSPDGTVQAKDDVSQVHQLYPLCHLRARHSAHRRVASTRCSVRRLSRV